MSLRVYTASIKHRGEDDAFDVSRGSGGEAGAPFAPSQPLLQRYWRVKREARADRKAWGVYATAYAQEMVASRAKHPDAWAALLARSRVVLCCYCPSGERCHRRLLAEILATLGATDEGELET